MSANIFGYSTFGIASSGVPGANNILADYDLYITTTSGHTVNLNSNKTSGDLTINKDSSGCNVVIETGNLTITDGDLMVDDIVAENLTLSETLTTPALVSTTGEPYGTTTIYYSLEYDDTEEFVPVNGSFTDNQASLVLSDTEEASEHTYIVEIIGNAGVQASIIVTLIPTLYIDCTNVTPNPVTLVASVFPMEMEGAVDGVWYALTTDEAYLQQEDSPGSDTWSTFSTPILWRVLNSTTSSWSSPNTSVTMSPLQFRFILPTLAVNTNYRLIIGSYTTQTYSWTPYAPGVIGTGPIIESYVAYSQGVASVVYTETQVNGVPPSNTTSGLTMMDVVTYNTILYKWTSDWFGASVNYENTFTHNLNMISIFPFRVQVLWSATGTTSYPMTDITSQGFINIPTSGVVGSYCITMISANEFGFKGGPLSVAVTLDESTLEPVAQTTGFWCIFIF
jgi:hypothetical protein